MLGPNRPAITYALRGSLSLELEVKGAAGDLHSGNYGGALHNPLQALCEIVAKLHDSSGRITVPGIYDRVRCWGSRERDYMARVGPTDREILAHARTARGWGECGYSLYERTTIRPALNVTGITGGHQGAGGKSIVPARALAKIDIRLVPDQDPSEIERLFRAHICRLTPAAVRSEVRTFFRTKPRSSTEIIPRCARRLQRTGKVLEWLRYLFVQVAAFPSLMSFRNCSARPLC